MLATKPGFSAYETPILFRILLAAVTPVYGAAAAFHPTALEIFGRTAVSQQRRRCQQAINIDQHRALTIAYTVVWSFETFIPTVKTPLRTLAATWNLDLTVCDRLDCTDISTPWGLAKSMIKDTERIFALDGWNADGALSSRYNRIPYADWRSNPYEPRDCPSAKCWQPLTEHSTYGYLVKQTHVVPHIGETARSYFLGNADICNRTLPTPNIKYRLESRTTLNRTAFLTDRLKAEVEYFDPKLSSLGLLEVQYFLRTGFSLDSFEFISLDTAIFATVYESVIVAWKEKVFHDRARPTSYIQTIFDTEIVYSYLGNTDKVAGNIMANTWQAYARVMPHAEFPSGSSCLCTSFAKAMTKILGSDSVIGALGGPLSVTIPAGASIYEAGKPAADVTLTWDKWSDVAKRCGVSRLEGGIHYPPSVTAGESLCGSIGDKVGQYFISLTAGAVPTFVANVDDTTVSETRCAVRNPVVD